MSMIQLGPCQRLQPRRWGLHRTGPVAVLKEEVKMPNPMDMICSECGAACSKDEVVVIDDQHICRQCLYGDVPPVQIYPIGFVRNQLERDDTDFGTKGKAERSRIELFPSQKRFMYRLEEERDITVVYYLHQARPVRSTFKRGLDGKEVGVFASRTPDRLSRIGIQDVRLVGVENTTLIVEGLDAINGTPLLDIKMKWSRK
ncbi:MAG: tRNA (adenine37-N6)-methyltransferase [Thermodesulfobacteriota bacterium]|nr:tRNA (adenine37-N6)-methyltransferase [Thermodesulfobacteriota bacterium]